MYVDFLLGIHMGKTVPKDLRPYSRLKAQLEMFQKEYRYST